MYECGKACASAGGSRQSYVCVCVPVRVACGLCACAAHTACLSVHLVLKVAELLLGAHVPQTERKRALARCIARTLPRAAASDSDANRGTDKGEQQYTRLRAHTHTFATYILARRHTATLSPCHVCMCVSACVCVRVTSVT
jgi:hypothetical protein